MSEVTIMAFTPNNVLTSPVANSFDIVNATVDSVKRLSIDEQLGLLWVIYTEMGRAITPAAPGAARLQFAEGLLNKIREIPHSEQLEFMRDLIKGVNNPLTRAYGVLTANNKLAFWYQLAQWMEDGTVIPVPAHYQLTQAASTIFGKICTLEFNQQISILRKIVVDMGVDPLA